MLRRINAELHFYSINELKAKSVLYYLLLATIWKGLRKCRMNYEENYLKRLQLKMGLGGMNPYVPSHILYVPRPHIGNGRLGGVRLVCNDLQKW